MDGALHVEDDAELRRRVTVAGSPWQLEYRRRVAEIAASVDASSGESEQAVSLLLRVPLPHIADGAALECRQRGGRVWLTSQHGALEVAEAQVDGMAPLVWGDPTTDSVTTRVIWHSSTSAEVVESRLADLAGLAETDVARTVALVSALADDLRTGSLASALRLADACFKLGEAPQPILCLDVARAVRARVAVDIATARLGPGGSDEAKSAEVARTYADLVQLLVDVDAELASFEKSTFVMDDAQYEAAVDGAIVDEDAWWGARARLDSRLTDLETEGALASMSKSDAQS
jgi:hypothetical protein